MAKKQQQFQGLDYFTQKPLTVADLWIYGSGKGNWLEGICILGLGTVLALAFFYVVIPVALYRSLKETRQNVKNDLNPAMDALLNAVGSSAGSNARKRRAELLARVRREQAERLKLPEGWPEDDKTECF